MDLLESAPDPFGGVVLTPDSLPAEPRVFVQRLRRSLAAWESAGYRVVWLELPIGKAQLISLAVDAGFSFHHCDERILMLTRRLVEDAYVPPYASHFTGAGGVVLNENDELLVVSERHGRRSNVPYYKLPGGALKEGEHLAAGVVREVFEETGVCTRFEALICLRNLHGYRYGKSDIYFVCRLSPLSHRISIQIEEIEECLWMPLAEYLGSENVSLFNKEIVQAALGSPGLVPKEIDGYRDPEKYEVFMPTELSTLG